MKVSLIAKHSESINLESMKTEDIFRSRSEDTIAHYNNTVCSDARQKLILGLARKDCHLN